jgi:hypothetical protein
MKMEMSQSGLLGAALIAGFFIYLAMQGKLGAYWSLMTGGGATGGATSGGGIAPSATPSNPNPGLTGSQNTPGALTGNPSTGFGFFPALGTILNPFTGQPLFPQFPTAPAPAQGAK